MSRIAASLTAQAQPGQRFVRDGNDNEKSPRQQRPPAEFNAHHSLEQACQGQGAQESSGQVAGAAGDAHSAQHDARDRLQLQVFALIGPGGVELATAAQAHEAREQPAEGVQAEGQGMQRHAGIAGGVRVIADGVQHAAHPGVVQEQVDEHKCD
jgi:hypothetical protein